MRFVLLWMFVEKEKMVKLPEAGFSEILTTVVAKQRYVK